MRIGQVKANIRVLGLAMAPLGGGFAAVGAVYRGRVGLEGVICAWSPGGDVTDGFLGALAGSRHRGQVRVILVDEASLPEGCTVDPLRLAAGSGKPVLALGAGGTLDAVTAFAWGDRRVVCAGLGETDAARLLDAVSAGGHPEALRVAGLVAGALGAGLHKV
ncbi:hypothetical protein A3K69_04090 [Candidatus Bathyarchaeota archaeon RBG_16_57_9]|nr:MAG: hypothetical protein A3K69_04090 [Candidatus Bathyarchaeota archaeon RBG_16_57_9]OGD52346.1 MAG: hypothetical protein A3K81_04085 [Candidatus Bathyarchaeota archaeon RBG_13_60_20]